LTEISNPNLNVRARNTLCVEPQRSHVLQKISAADVLGFHAEYMQKNASILRFDVRSEALKSLSSTMHNTHTNNKPIYLPKQGTYYVFRQLPKSDEERASFLFKEARDRQETVAYASTVNADSEEQSRIRAYRTGLRTGQAIYKALPLLRMHPVHRMLHLVRKERDEMYLTKDDLTKDEVKASYAKLDLIETLITQSLKDYPEELDSPLIQGAFHAAHTLEDGEYIGQASLHSIGERHWEDVKVVSEETAEQKHIHSGKFRGPVH